MKLADGSATARQRPREAAWGIALAALGAWAAVIPYLGRAVGLTVDVAARVEFVDHVVPGVIVVLIGTWLVLLARRPAGRGDLTSLVAAGLAFLAGFWTLATHVPLLVEAARGLAPWGAALLHASAGPPIVVLTLWLVLRADGR